MCTILIKTQNSELEFEFSATGVLNITYFIPAFLMDSNLKIIE